MKQFATVRLTQAAAKYGEQAPMTAVCCNACRTCVTTNVVGLATGALAGTWFGVAQFARRILKPS
jgi:hypothetical protein